MATDGDDRAEPGGGRRGGLVRVRRRLLAVFRPPQPWTHRPPSLQTLARYAARGGWAGPEGAVRKVGVWWFRLIAVPATVVAHYVAWLAARPARAVVAAAAWATVMQLAPARTLAGLVLPWNPWPAPTGPVWLVTAAAVAALVVWATTRSGDDEEKKPARRGRSNVPGRGSVHVKGGKE